MNPFIVGDICIVHSLVINSELNRMECTLLYKCKEGDFDKFGISCSNNWMTDLIDNYEYSCVLREANLKHKKFDGEDSVTRMFNISLTEKNNLDIISPVEETI